MHASFPDKIAMTMRKTYARCSLGGAGSRTAGTTPLSYFVRNAPLSPQEKRLCEVWRSNTRYGFFAAERILFGKEQLSDVGDENRYGVYLVHVARLKNGMDSVHPLRGPELRALRRLQREDASAAYVFVSERKAPLTPHTVRKIVARAGRQAGIAFPIHPHMLRHATGYKLANDGQDTRAIQQYLGHRNIQHTTRYTDLAPNRFKDFWRD